MFRFSSSSSSLVKTTKALRREAERKRLCNRVRARCVYPCAPRVLSCCWVCVYGQGMCCERVGRWARGQREGVTHLSFLSLSLPTSLLFPSPFFLFLTMPCRGRINGSRHDLMMLRPCVLLLFHTCPFICCLPF